MKRSTRGPQNKPFVSGGTLYQSGNQQNSFSASKIGQNNPNIQISPGPAKPVSAPPQQLQQQQLPPSSRLQQYQQQSSSQLQQQQQQQPFAQLQQQQVPSEQSKPTAIKTEQKIQEQQSASNSTENVEMETVLKSADNNDSDGGEAAGKQGFFRRLLFKNKKKPPSVRSKERRIRQSRMIKRVLIPKNALMALYEVKNIKIEDFVVTVAPGGGFNCVVTVNGVQYEGKGSSKNAAKANVCEKAFRDLVITKMNARLSRASSVDNVSANDVEMKDLNAEGGAGGDHEEDDYPIINLASFALFKLYSEWESEGFEVPEFRQNQSNGNQNESNSTEPKPKKPPTVRAELPNGWETMHPATLMCIMRPGVTYVDLGTEGVAPNQSQKIGLTVDDKHFIGVGSSKKIARKNAAAQACNALFNTSFENFTK